jgi:hypothetical protein
MMPLQEDSYIHTITTILEAVNNSKLLAMDLEMVIACLKFCILCGQSMAQWFKIQLRDLIE